MGLGPESMTGGTKYRDQISKIERLLSCKIVLSKPLFGEVGKIRERLIRVCLCVVSEDLLQMVKTESNFEMY